MAVAQTLPCPKFKTVFRMQAIVRNLTTQEMPIQSGQMHVLRKGRWRSALRQIEILKGKLEELPQLEDPDRKISNLEAVRMMASSIRDLQSRGYSIEKIAEILRESGLEIAPTTLKSYLTKVKGSTGKSHPRPVSKSRRPSPSTNREEKKNASEKTPASVNSKPAGNSKISTGVTPVLPGSFTPKEDSDEI
ncbi:putative mobilization protein, MobC (plasmid) [Pseudomonas cerasi]|uniref:Putative mobilization protein, MobC n=1 Tax=Pseudomonas cerasi TaxID=1583341 RepID=A0A2K4W2C2_9PSED|nr:hypothetical protein [Pseudomonas cerasi]SOS30043.1 putative mobilization protein, MobC [Pseudomonas cerasi]